MQTLTFEQVKIAALIAYIDNRLLAQNVPYPGAGTATYGYKLGNFVCAIGAALSPDSLDAMQAQGWNSSGLVNVLSNAGIIELAPGDAGKCIALQNAHDMWLTAVSNGEDSTAIESMKQSFVSLLGKSDNADG